ncbi:MAG: dTMP kinase [Pseudomonadota bacterium]
MKSLFITFEGGEGSGKTTQIKLLAEYFKNNGKKCLLTREPGGSQGSEAIRDIILNGSADKWHDVTELLLFQAARVEHVERVIKPALASGNIVLCDRFLDSSIVYQGIGKGLGVQYVEQIHQLTLGNFAPDFTIILDIEPEKGLKRAKSRSHHETRFENMELEFHKKVREGFLSLTKNKPERYIVLDASGDIRDIHATIIDKLG